MKNFLRRNLPIGYSVKKERNVFAICMAGAVLFSMMFLSDYGRARESLFRYVAGGLRKELIPGAVMDNFVDILGYSMAAVFAIYYFIYVQATPEEVLRQGQWSLVLEKWGMF